MRSKEDIKKYQQEYRRLHKEQRQIYDQNRYSENEEYFKDKNHEYYLSNKETIINNSNQYYIDNKDLVKENHRVYIKDKRNNDIGFNLRSQISKNINRILKSNGYLKNDSCLKYLLYTIQELKIHLESQFEPWMSWNNWGVYNKNSWKDDDSSTWTWQLDHIIPQSKLSYINMEEDNFKRCWSLNNLRPYSAKQNLLEGNRR